MSDHAKRLSAALEGRYSIERQLGEGGMATVYLAEDLKHHRQVAVKVLKPELAALVGARRFLAEIETTAHLQHPNILPLFDSGEAEGTVFFVMPYVEDETLRARLARETQLPVDEAVRIASEVAEALDHAHRQGVIHRDIKPGNILLREGRPLVADFGIALAAQAAGGERLTETGLSLGTPHYMSPEQATGDQEIGRRSDVYALGCVLYEMLVGEPPYTGNTLQAVLGRIIVGDLTPPAAVRPSIPPHVDAAVRKALEALPADRFRTAGEFGKALTDPSVMAGAAAPEGWLRSSGMPVRRRWQVALLAGAALALGAVLARGFRPGPAPEVRRWALSFPEGQAPAFRTGGMSILPDGSAIVYAVSRAGGNANLFFRPFDALEGRPLPGTERAWAPRVSPDGRSVAFDELGAGRGLRVVTVEGGPVSIVTDSLAVPYSWGPSGMLYALNQQQGPPRGIGRVPAEGGPVEILTTADTDADERHINPYVMPDGDAVVFTIRHGPETIGTLEDARIAVLSMKTREVKILTRGFHGRYVASGHLLFVRPDGRLYATPFDTRRLELTGSTVPVVDDVAFDERGISAYDVSDNGTLVYTPGGIGEFEAAVVWVDRSGAEYPTPLEGLGDEPRLSPDGTRVATDVEGDLWVFDLLSGTMSRITYEEDIWHVGWSPDGRDLLFVSDRSGPAVLYSMPADGTGPVRLLYQTDADIDEGTWSPDGTYLILELWDPEQRKGTIVYTRPGVDTIVTRVSDGTANEDFPELSPDGRWLAYTAEEESGREEVYVRPFPGPGGARLISRDGGTAPLWAHSGEELFYVAGDSVLITARISTESGFAVESQTRLFNIGPYYYSDDRTTYGVTPDGQRFLFQKRRYRGGETGSAQVFVVQNFFEELRRRVPR